MHPKRPKILIAIIDGDRGNVVDRYLEDIGDLDAFELKRLLQNVCDGILSEYRRGLKLGYERELAPQTVP